MQGARPLHSKQKVANQKVAIRKTALIRTLSLALALAVAGPIAQANLRLTRPAGTHSVGMRPQTQTKAQAKAAAKAPGYRLQHARELLGPGYRKSVVRLGERVSNLNPHVYQWTKDKLQGRYKKDSRKIARAILEESEKHRFDPVFLMAVIENESSFNPEAKGTSGEIGLMQILPGTGKWIAEKVGVKWKGEKTLRDPVTNIRLGAAYLAHLRGNFESHSRLYLSAYNMGSARLRQKIENNEWPSEYSSRVMKRYVQYYRDLKASGKG